MKLDLDALNTLDAIATHGSFAKAADALFRVPSAVTYTVRKLEEHLGVELFDRSGHRAVLTPVGHTLLTQGRALLQQADALERRIRQAGQGWEPRLVIAVDEIIPIEQLYPVIEQFDLLRTGSQLALTREVFGGTWDALIDRRADLVVGAPDEPPPGFSVGMKRLGHAAFVFVVTPDHPLAQLPEPLSFADISAYRAIVAADSSRRLPTRSGGLQPGQATLVVPTLDAKLKAQIAGLGVGYLPLHLARPFLDSGQLVAREIEGERPPVQLNVAWRSGENGRALSWFRDAILRDGRIAPRAG